MNKSFEELDQLENQLNINQYAKKKIEDMSNINTEEKFKRYTSDKSATLSDFISMLQKLTTNTIGQKHKVEFYPEEGRVPVEYFSEQLNSSIITYELISREPMKELKYRYRESIIERDEHGNIQRQGEVYGQKQKLNIQFNFFAGTVEEVESIMTQFEDNMFIYKGYFKKNGVGELIFKEQLTDKSLDSFRQTTSVRSLIYYVELEKLIEKFDEDIIAIDSFNTDNPIY